MVDFKSFNNIVLDILQQLRLTQPSLDTKPNSVARDLFVDSQAQQIANVYEVLRDIASLQSVSNLVGQDLTNYGSNYGLTRRTGTKSVGTAVVTFRSLDNDVIIPSGAVVRTRGGIPFVTISSTTVLTTQINSLRATATRLRQELDTASITDEFAIEVSVEAQSSGSSGNISSYALVSHSISDVGSVTNISSFVGGTDLETDASFRSRILATFAGANVGTAVGYRSVVLNLPDAIDALVVEPGDPLMIRDGTVVVTDSDGVTTVSEPGTGGRVDVYVLGSNPTEGTDSFVYNDKSGKDDPTNSLNDFVLGQSSLTADITLSLNSRRVQTLSEGADIPEQPVTNIVSVSGSSSGPNFVEQFLDTDGQLKGNFKLVKDTGSAGGSPFGLDKLVWTSGTIDLENESRTKGTFNGIDGLAFTDVAKIPEIRQDLQITNENSIVSSSSRDFITVSHKPVRTVTRVFNLTTGERYTVTDQTPDDSGDINNTGRVKISGRTLPTASDILQVDYIWIYPYDGFIDYDNLDPQDAINTAQDSVEWGFSNYIRDESSTAILDAYSNLTVKTVFPITRVLSVNTFISESATVASDKTVTVSTTVTNVSKITDSTLSGSPEVYNTKENDGSFSGAKISLPSDTLAQSGDTVTVVYNLDDVLDVEGFDTGKIINNEITLLPSTVVSSGTAVKVNYVADFLNLLPQSNIASLPISSDGFNSFTDVDGYQPVQNNFSGSTVTSNQRRSPSSLRVTTSSIPNQGTLRFVGTTINKYTGIFTATQPGDIDLSILIREAENLSKSATIPSTISLARVTSVEKVTLNSSNQVDSVVVDFDLTNYGLKSNEWDKQNAIEVSSLDKTKIQLSGTSINTSNPVITGNVIRVTFYYSKTLDIEDLFYSRNGTAITNKRFGHISSISRFSGFQDSGGTISGNLIIDSFNQPLQNSAYLVDYSYTSPKENERITVNFEYNKLLVDATSALETRRPITADVLAKLATEIALDVDVKVIVLDSFKDKKETVRQNVADNITSTLNATSLGTTIDESDIVTNVYNVDGVDRVRVVRFNNTGITGTKLSISAEKKEYLAAGIVTVEIEER